MNWRTGLAILLLVVGLVGIAAGLIYLTTNVHNLPTWFPGYVAKASDVHTHTNRGTAGVIAGGLCMLAGLIVAIANRRRNRRHGW